MLNFVKTLFSGGAVKSIENIASEWIETDLESAEAKVLMVKTLDPNGKLVGQKGIAFCCQKKTVYKSANTCTKKPQLRGVFDLLDSPPH